MVRRIDANRVPRQDIAASLVPAVVLIRRLRHGRGTQEAKRDGSRKRNQSLTACHMKTLPFAVDEASASSSPENGDVSRIGHQTFGQLTEMIG
jgi:hypothetical protein